MKNLTLLSHVYDSTTPGYGGSQCFSRTTASSIQAGRSSNSESWSLSNHSGTHIDFPGHFFDGAATLTSYDTHQFQFAKAALIDLPVELNHLISIQDLKGIQAPAETELLLIRTGFEKHRGQEAYWNNNPGLHPETADFLRSRFLKLRAIGFDFISLTSYQNRELGREAHKQFLNPSKPLWIIEDMKLSALKAFEFEALISPLMVQNADGTPVNVYAFNFSR